MLEELACVVLEVDLPELGLVRGDAGAIVLVHGNGDGYEVEFGALNGETLAVVTLNSDQFRPARKGEIFHTRLLAS